ncbi:MAG: HAMP domain-containing sensor histidine kinase [bacterium]
MQAGSDVSQGERRTNPDRRLQRGGAPDALRAIVERMADGVLVVNHVGTIRFANPAADRLFGRSETELVGSHLGFPVVGESTEIDIVRPGGTCITVELRAADSDWNGERAILVSLRDISDRKSLEVERVARARADAASIAKSEFLTLMSHELRTPLNAVIGYAELVGIGLAGPVTTEQRAHLERIRANGEHLLELVDEMIDLARAGEGQLALLNANAEAVRLANDALGDVRATAVSRGVHLSRACTGGDGAVFTGDAERVRQILRHLLHNAVKFTPRGGNVNCECGVAAKQDDAARALGPGPWVYVRVSDNGAGIAPDQLTSIFDPFTQVDRGHARASDGSGLGLTISRSLSRLMKGDLTVQSELGRGSRFTLWLPAATSSIETP